jgi:hypothetical protein
MEHGQRPDARDILRSNAMRGSVAMEEMKAITTAQRACWCWSVARPPVARRGLRLGWLPSGCRSSSLSQYRKCVPQGGGWPCILGCPGAAQHAATPDALRAAHRSQRWASFAPALAGDCGQRALWFMATGAACVAVERRRIRVSGCEWLHLPPTHGSQLLFWDARAPTSSTSSEPLCGWMFVPTSPAIRASSSSHSRSTRRQRLDPPRLQLIAPRHAEPAIATVAAFRQPSPADEFIQRVRQQHDNTIPGAPCLPPTTAASHSPRRLCSVRAAFSQA